MYRNGKWVREILALQRPDGLWGPFHTLSEPRINILSTEQALRRLRILGYATEDAPIQRALYGLHEYLAGTRPIPDRREKTIDWDIFMQLMPAAWITLFTDKDELANAVASKWAGLITKAFAGGSYDEEAYCTAYAKEFSHRPAHGRSQDICHFYLAAILRNRLEPSIARAFFHHLLYHPAGIYYMCPRPLKKPPASFFSKEASRYLGTLELLSEYEDPACREQLRFAADWLLAHRDENGEWDMGAAAKDGVYFPLSDSWRTAEDRKMDCTHRIRAFLLKVAPEA
jgi:hypothetical protein